MLRQTDEVRITDRCYEPTYYPGDEDRRCVHPTCQYLVNGSCELVACVRREYEKTK